MYQNSSLGSNDSPACSHCRCRLPLCEASVCSAAPWNSALMQSAGVVVSHSHLGAIIGNSGNRKANLRPKIQL